MQQGLQIHHLECLMQDCRLEAWSNVNVLAALLHYLFECLLLLVKIVMLL
ncbi:hypothetical protein RchiOBHm_Chr4g0384951 [Rosa chinensis]|uniref:Uncharacterized protein n=1 Tax=Rosa chinensis TaxID=74649 RepID=A0A2P6QNT8_ROSCH|nr:hypothetical protein RchiOBHm_Chr4g0384951 [Rosa chinensis]